MIEFPDFWINTEIVSFLRSDADHLCLNDVTIEKIWWRNSEHARLLLTAPMPNGSLLFGLKDGDSILLSRKICGPPTEFFSDEVVMACHDCHIRRKWLLNLSPKFSEQEIICIYVSLDCCFEIIGTEEGEDA